MELKASLNSCFLATESAGIVGFGVERIGESGVGQVSRAYFISPRGAEVLVVQGSLYLFSAALLGLSGRMMEQSKTDSPCGGWVLDVTLGCSLSTESAEIFRFRRML